jgi:hypothetical protein
MSARAKSGTALSARAQPAGAGFRRTKRQTRATPECALCTTERLPDDPAGLCPAHRERLDAVVATARRHRAERLARWAAP